MADDTFGAVGLPHRQGGLDGPQAPNRARVVTAPGVHGGRYVDFGDAPHAYVFRGFVREDTYEAYTTARDTILGIRRKVATLVVESKDYGNCAAGVPVFTGFDRVVSEGADAYFERYEIVFLQLVPGNPSELAGA